MSEAGAAANGRRKPARSKTSKVTRRRLLRGGITTVAAVGGTAAALHPMLAARAPGGGDVTDGAGSPLFDEIYRDRRIQGFANDDESGVDILIDGRTLQVMRRVDGSWISLADHYQPYLTPLATARGAVDVIGRAELSTNFEHHH